MAAIINSKESIKVNELRNPETNNHHLAHEAENRQNSHKWAIEKIHQMIAECLVMAPIKYL